MAQCVFHILFQPIKWLQMANFFPFFVALLVFPLFLRTFSCILFGSLVFLFPFWRAQKVYFFFWLFVIRIEVSLFYCCIFHVIRVWTTHVLFSYCVPIKCWIGTVFANFRCLIRVLSLTCLNKSWSGHMYSAKVLCSNPIILLLPFWTICGNCLGRPQCQKAPA